VEQRAGQSIDLLLNRHVTKKEKRFSVIPSEIAMKLFELPETCQIGSDWLNSDVVPRPELRPVSLRERAAKHDDRVLRHFWLGNSCSANRDSGPLDRNV
jgi:hypothetical protein